MSSLALSDLAAGSLIRQGYEAYGKREYLDALQRFSLALLLEPKNLYAIGGGAQTLRELRLFDKADDLVRWGMEFSPEDFHLGEVWGWIAAHRRNWPEAVSRFAPFYRRDVDRNYFGIRYGYAIALYESRQLAEAEKVLREPPLPETADYVPARNLLKRINEAQLAGSDSLGGLRTAAAAEPDKVEHRLRLIDALRSHGRLPEAEEAAEAALERFPENFFLLTSYSQCAQAAGRWTVALERWEAVKTLFPGVADGYVGCGTALRHLGRVKEAEVLIAPGLRIFPNHWGLQALHAHLAGDRKDVSEALKRWRNVQNLVPAQRDGYIGEIGVLIENHRFSEAEPLLVEARGRFPTDFWFASEYARLPRFTQNWQEVVRRWRQVCGDSPDFELAHSELVMALLETKAFDEAKEAVAQGLVRFPDSLELKACRCEVLERLGALAEAEAGFRALRALAPKFLRTTLGLARVLNQQSRQSEALEVLEPKPFVGGAAIAVMLERARIAIQLRDWPLAFSVLESVKRQVPTHGGAKGLITDAILHFRQDQAMGGFESLQVPEILLRTDEDEASEALLNRHVLIRFESLGDSCEFGMVQRRYGAEPLSLLRWTGTTPDGLVAALSARLAGIGDPEYTELNISPNGAEYTTLDRRFGMFSHTFTPSFSVPREKFHAAQCKRMQFMRNKLLDDFQNSEKVFVYGSALLNDDNIVKLHAAARALGKNVWLMCVRKADENHVAGTVIDKGNGLLVGAVSHFSTVNIAVQDWLAVCRQALALAGRNSGL